jgi:hypothetical protein
MRDFEVARKAALPLLPLASTQNRTITNLPRYVLAGEGAGGNGYAAGFFLNDG